MAAELVSLPPVLVAGAGGFVGSHLVRGLLDRGAPVHALVRPGSEAPPFAGAGGLVVHEVDAADAAAVRTCLLSVRPEAVVNLVRGRHWERPDLTALAGDNVLTTAALLDAASLAGCAHFVHVGSSTEYRPGHGPLDSRTPLEPVTAFGAAKAAASLLCRAHAAMGAMKIAILRPFQIYGPGDNPRHLVPKAIAAALEGSELRLAPHGRRDWIFVEDVAEACVLAVEQRATGELSIGTGRQWTNAEVVAAVAEACGREIRVRIDEDAARRWDRDDWVADPREAELLLGWRPRHDLRSGLASTVECARTTVAAGR